MHPPTPSPPSNVGVHMFGIFVFIHKVLSLPALILGSRVNITKCPNSFAQDFLVDWSNERNINHTDILTKFYITVQYNHIKRNYSPTSGVRCSFTLNEDDF